MLQIRAPSRARFSFRVVFFFSQATIISRLMTEAKSINAERNHLLQENCLLKLKNSAMAHDLASLVPRTKGPVTRALVGGRMRQGTHSSTNVR